MIHTLPRQSLCQQRQHLIHSPKNMWNIVLKYCRLKQFHSLFGPYIEAPGGIELDIWLLVLTDRVPYLGRD